MTEFVKFAFRMGEQAYHAGRDIHANPYKVKSPSWYAWRQGWNFVAVRETLAQ